MIKEQMNSSEVKKANANVGIAEEVSTKSKAADKRYSKSRSKRVDKDSEENVVDLGDLFDELIYSNVSESRKPIYPAVESWLSKIKYKYFLEEIKFRVKGQEELDKVVANVYNYLECIAKGRRHNNNMIITAPSGCGKTETYRAIKDYFNKYIPSLPIYQLDMTSITEEGYKGKNTTDIVKPLLACGSISDGVGIVFLDEFDKKIVPSFNNNGGNINLAVQSQILTLIEGRTVTDGGRSIDTSNTLFIALGSFDECRKSKAEVIHHVGFGKENEGGASHYSPISREDIIELGGSYELIGRFATIINYHELDDEMLDSIINYIADRVGNSYGCTVTLSEEFREEVRKNRNSKYGCRMYESMIREAALEGYMEKLDNDYDSDSCRLVLLAGGHARCELLNARE